MFLLSFKYKRRWHLPNMTLHEILNACAHWSRCHSVEFCCVHACCPLTTSLWSVLVKSKEGRMDLNLLRMSLCLVMSVARMHLRWQRKRKAFCVLSSHREEITWENVHDLTWWFPPLSVCIDPWTDFWRCCTLSAQQTILVSFFVKLKRLIYGNLDKEFSSIPSPVAQKLQHSDGSPAERCHCSEELVRFWRWSEMEKGQRSIWCFWLEFNIVNLGTSGTVSPLHDMSTRMHWQLFPTHFMERWSSIFTPDRHCCTLCGRGRGTLQRSAWSAGRCRPFCSWGRSARSDRTSVQR